MFLYFILYIESIYARICKYRVLIITFYYYHMTRKAMFDMS